MKRDRRIFEQENLLRELGVYSALEDEHRNENITKPIPQEGDELILSTYKFDLALKYTPQQIRASKKAKSWKTFKEIKAYWNKGFYHKIGVIVFVCFFLCLVIFYGIGLLLIAFRIYYGIKTGQWD